MSPADDGAEDLLGGFICRVNFEIFEEPASERQAPCAASVSFSSTTSRCSLTSIPMLRHQISFR